MINHDKNQKMQNSLTFASTKPLQYPTCNFSKPFQSTNLHLVGARSFSISVTRKLFQGPFRFCNSYISKILTIGGSIRKTNQAVVLQVLQFGLWFLWFIIYLKWRIKVLGWIPICFDDFGTFKILTKYGSLDPLFIPKILHTSRNP